MTYDEDPTRWTSSPDEAPELLRGAFAAGRDEGPSRGQMRSLALKIAAASAGGAVAVGTVKAASAGHAIATAATWSVGKIAAVVALAGTLVTGGALVWQARTRTDTSTQAERETAEPAPAATASGVEMNTGHTEPAQPQIVQGAERASANETTSAAAADSRPIVQELRSATERSADVAAGAVAATTDDARAPSRGAAKTLGAQSKPSGSAANGKPAAATGRATPSARADVPAGARPSNVVVKASAKGSAPQSEITLLRRAQLALQARPREAFQLTQEHRRLYPAGEFAQERDALAIEALMRVGDSENARDLATSFIRAYPSSPHAHRFREAMGLR